jgi:integrase
MPKLTKRLPAHSRHKASGRGVVRLNGRDYYTGVWGTKASKSEYSRLVARWLSGELANGADDLTIDELVVKYWRFARTHYVKNGLPTDEQDCIRAALRPLLVLYQDEQAAEFGPKSLKAVRDQMIEVGHCRQTINKNIGRIRRMFKWAVSEELVPVEVHQRLATVSGLQRGRTEAKEAEPVQPVTDQQIEAVLPHVSATVADMIRFQRLTGCRPNEVCQLRPCDIDRTGDVWKFTPASHKTEHRGRDRVILIGPKAQAVLTRYLARGADMFCFRPVDSEAKRRAERHAARKTPLNVGNKPGSSRKRRPRRGPTDRYTTGTYRRAIERGCDLAFPLPLQVRRAKGETMKLWRQRLKGVFREIVTDHWKKHRWSPNQLRHTAATEIRSQFGLEASQIILGHSNADVTQVYAARDLAKGIEVARMIG